MHRQFKFDRTKIKKATPQSELPYKVALDRLNRDLLSLSIVIRKKDVKLFERRVMNKIQKIRRAVKQLENSNSNAIIRIGDLRLYRIMTNRIIESLATYLSLPFFEHHLRRNSPKLTHAMINLLSTKLDKYTDSCNYLSFLTGISTSNSGKVRKIIEAFNKTKSKHVNLMHLLPFVLRNLNPEHFAETIPMLKELITRLTLLDTTNNKVAGLELKQLVDTLDDKKNIQVVALLLDVLCDFEDSTLRTRAFTHTLLMINNLINSRSIDPNLHFFEMEFADSPHKNAILRKIASVQSIYPMHKGMRKILATDFEDRRDYLKALIHGDDLFLFITQPGNQLTFHRFVSGMGGVTFAQKKAVLSALSILIKDETLNETALREEAARIQLLSKLKSESQAKDLGESKSTLEFVNELNEYVDRGMNPLNRIQENWRFQNELEFHYVKSHVMGSRRIKRFIPVVSRNFATAEDLQKKVKSLEKAKAILKTQLAETAKTGKINIDQKSLMDVDHAIFKFGRENASQEKIVEEILAYIEKLNGDEVKLSRVFKSLFLYESFVNRTDSSQSDETLNSFTKIVLPVLMTNRAENDSNIMVKNDSKFGMIEMDFNQFAVNKAFNFKLNDKIYLSLMSSFDNSYSDIKFKILVSHYLKFESKVSLDISSQIYSICRRNRLPMLLIYILHNQISRGVTNNQLFYEALDHLSVFKYFNEEGINLFVLMFKKHPEFYSEISKLGVIFESLIVNDQQKELFIDFEQLKNLFESNLYVANPDLSPEKNLELEEEHKVKQLEHKKNLYSIMFGLCVKYRIKSYSDMLFNEMTNQNYFNSKEDIMNMIRYAQRDRFIFRSTIQYILETLDAANNDKINFTAEETDEVIALMVKRAKEHERQFLRVFKLFFGKTKARIADSSFVECLKFFYITEDFKAFEIFLKKVEAQVKAVKIQLNPVSKSIALKVCSKCKDDSLRFTLINTLDSIFSYERRIERSLAHEMTDEDFKTLIDKTQAIIDSRFDLKYSREYIPKDKNKPKPSRPIKDRRNALTTLIESMHESYLAQRIERSNAQNAALKNEGETEGAQQRQIAK